MNILEKINETKKEEVKNLRRDFTISQFKDSKFFEKEHLKFAKNLNQENAISIISEIKKASPSKGIIRHNFNHIEIANLYQDYANAISILTDELYFKGNKKYLSDVADFTKLPLLRKDFIIDEYQIYESKSIGADAILLIAELLSANQIHELTKAANENNLEVLLEIHSVKQIEKIDFSLNKIIGINNRNLEDFSVDINTSIKLSSLLPEDITLISESGVSKIESIEKLKGTRINAVLIGELLMKSTDIKSLISNLKNWCSYEG